MSYDIYIGEAVIDVPHEEDLADGCNRLDVRVEPFNHPKAPVFHGDMMTGNSNSRHPGYSQWSTFTEKVGLDNLFFNKSTGLMRNHPGTCMLTKDHLDQVIVARKKWEAKNPGKKPGWCGCHDCEQLGPRDNKEPHVPEYDGNLARVLWLEWWFDWALNNCKVPAICNR